MYADGFTMDAIYECGEVSIGFPHKVFLGTNKFPNISTSTSMVVILSIPFYSFMTLRLSGSLLFQSDEINILISKRC